MQASKTTALVTRASLLDPAGPSPQDLEHIRKTILDLGTGASLVTELLLDNASLLEEQTQAIKDAITSLSDGASKSTLEKITQRETVTSTEMRTLIQELSVTTDTVLDKTLIQQTAVLEKFFKSTSDKSTSDKSTSDKSTTNAVLQLAGTNTSQLSELTQLTKDQQTDELRSEQVRIADRVATTQREALRTGELTDMAQEQLNTAHAQLEVLKESQTDLEKYSESISKGATSATTSVITTLSTMFAGDRLGSIIGDHVGKIINKPLSKLVQKVITSKLGRSAAAKFGKGKAAVKGAAGKGIAAMAVRAPQLLALAAAAGAGALIGTGISHLMDSTTKALTGGKNKTFGGFVFDKTHDTTDTGIKDIQQIRTKNLIKQGMDPEKAAALVQRNTPGEYQNTVRAMVASKVTDSKVTDSKVTDSKVASKVTDSKVTGTLPLPDVKALKEVFGGTPPDLTANAVEAKLQGGITTMNIDGDALIVLPKVGGTAVPTQYQPPSGSQTLTAPPAPVKDTPPVVVQAPAAPAPAPAPAEDSSMAMSDPSFMLIQHRALR